MSALVPNFSRSRPIISEMGLSSETSSQTGRGVALGSSKPGKTREGGPLGQNPVRASDVRSGDIPSKALSRTIIQSAPREPRVLGPRSALRINKSLPGIPRKIINPHITDSLAILEGKNGLGAHAMPFWPSPPDLMQYDPQRRNGVAFAPEVSRLEGLRNLTPEEKIADFKRGLLRNANPLPSWITRLPEREKGARALGTSSSNRSSMSSMGSASRSDADTSSTKPTSLSSSASSISIQESRAGHSLGIRDTRPRPLVPQSGSFQQPFLNSSASIAATAVNFGKPKMVKVPASLGGVNVENGSELRYVKPGIIRTVSHQQRNERLDAYVEPNNTNSSRAHSTQLETLKPTTYGGEQARTSSISSHRMTPINERPDDRRRGPEGR